MTVFLGDEALNHARNISLPRLPGSPGEKKATDYIIQRLRESGWSVSEEEFFISLTPWFLLKALVSVAFFFIILSRLLASFLPLLSGMLFFLTSLTFVFSLKIWMHLLHSNLLHKRKTGVKTKNILASLNNGMSPRKKRLFLIAHHDSKSQNLSLPLRAVMSSLLVVSLILSGVFSLLFHLKQEVIYINLLDILTVLSLLFLLFLLSIKTENKSFGSLDNASSVGILLELAGILKKNPPRNIDIHLLFTGAEEQGLIGASAFLNRYYLELDRERDLFLNLDSPVNKRLMVSLSKKRPKELFSLMREVSEEKGIKLSSLPFVPGLLMDHLSFSHKGLKALSLYSISKKSLSIHTHKDTPSLLEKEGLINTGLLIESVIRRLDIKENPLRVNAYSGYRGEEKPSSFFIKDKEYTIKETLSMTREEDKERRLVRRFKVRADTDEIFILFYDEELKKWFLEEERI